MLASCALLRDEGALVETVVCAIDREQGGRGEHGNLTRLIGGRVEGSNLARVDRWPGRRRNLTP